MVPRIRRVVAVFVVLTLVATVASGIPVLDQFQEGFAGSTLVGFDDPDTVLAAQTFTPGIGGLLDSVQIRSGVFEDSGSGLLVSILSTSGGVPTSTLLGSVLALSSGYLEDDWNTISLASQNIILAAGTTYALKLETTAGPDSIWWDHDWWVPGATTDTYPGGALFVAVNGGGWILADADVPGAVSNVDAMFRTFMDTDVQTAVVPEPLSLGLFGVGLTGLLLRKRVRPA